MKLSVIIPHWPFNKEIDDTLNRCVKSLFGYDELIIVVNDGTGIAKNINIGLRLAKGDFMCVINNDIVWTRGNIRDLMVENTVTSPRLNDGIQSFWSCFFCMPRSVYEVVGGFSEDYGLGYYEDDDFLMKLKQANIPTLCIENANINSSGSETMKHLDVSDMKELVNKNKEIFNKKWNI